MAALVDTTVVIDLANGQDKAMSFCHSVLQRSDRVYISTVTVMEVLVGAQNKKELNYLVALLSLFSTLPLTEDASATAISLITSYHLGDGLAIPDALIAATALVENLHFFTGNVRHFAMIPNLHVEKPY